MDLLSSLKEIQATQKNRISGKNTVFYVCLFMLKKRTRACGLHFIHTIWAHFFAPQLMRKYKLRKRPVAWVDHPLDIKFPFNLIMFLSILVLPACGSNQYPSCIVNSGGSPYMTLFSLLRN